MQVAQFLDALALCPDIEIIEPLLPDVLRRGVEQAGLRRVASPSRLRQYAPCEAEFESLHHGSRIFLLRFADQQMYVLGHDHVANDDKLIALAHLLQHPQKEVTAARSTKQGLSAITTASDEMKVTGTAVALDIAAAWPQRSDVRIRTGRGDGGTVQR